MSLLINKNPLIIPHNVFDTILRLIIFVVFTNIDIEKLLQIHRLTKLLIKNRILSKININGVFLYRVVLGILETLHVTLAMTRYYIISERKKYFDN